MSSAAHRTSQGCPQDDMGIVSASPRRTSAVWTSPRLLAWSPETQGPGHIRGTDDGTAASPVPPACSPPAPPPGRCGHHLSRGRPGPGTRKAASVPKPGALGPKWGDPRCGGAAQLHERELRGLRQKGSRLGAPVRVSTPWGGKETRELGSRDPTGVGSGCRPGPEVQEHWGAVPGVGVPTWGSSRQG